MKKIWFSIASIILTWFYALPALAASGGFLDEAKSTVGALVELKKELNDRYTVFVNTATVGQEFHDKLEPIQLKISSLSEQIATLTENIRRTKINLEVTQKETRKVYLRLADLSDLSATREVELLRAKQLLNEFVALSFGTTERYTDWRTGRPDTLKFLLSGDTLAQTELQQTYFKVLQKTLAKLARDLQSAKDSYTATQTELLVERGRLFVLQKQLLAEEDQLQAMQAGKERLLAETQGEESRYQALIAENQKQQAEALLAVEELKESIEIIDKKLKELETTVGSDKLAELLAEQGANGLNQLSFPGHIPRLAWPADPGRGITAYFRDPGYVQVFGVPHQAIDFRLYQGSPVHAAAPGIVFKAKDNGLGYSYIMLAHAGRLTTVYGHMSKIMVKEGEVVQAGDTIGLSGGSPGSPGAGYMTTGPHLHFEVIDAGEHRDPLDYLPLEPLQPADVPERFIDADRAASPAEAPTEEAGSESGTIQSE